MQNINLNDGMKELMINNDPQRVLRWNPTDSDFCKRYIELTDYINSLRDKLSELSTHIDQIGRDVMNRPEAEVSEEARRAADQMYELGAEATDMLDKTFNAPIGRIVFCGANPISVTDGGGFLLGNFLTAISPIIEDSINQAGRPPRKKPGRRQA